MLSRTGCIPYATLMVNALEKFDKYVFVSRYSPEVLPKDNHKVRTYRNRLEFVISTVLFLPILCIRLFTLSRKKGYQKAYFPVFHHWNPILIQCCLWLNIEVVFTVHDGVLHIGEQRKWEQKLLNFCIQKADKIVFLSEYVEKLTTKEIGFTSLSAVIPHPLLNVNLPAPKKRELPAQPALLFLGRVVDYKGIDLLLEALEGIPENKISRLTIAGREYNSLTLKYPENIPVERINRWLTDEELADLLNCHDILVLPYKEASQSGIITLGIASAIPMICTRVGGLKEQLTEKEAIFAEPTVEAIRSAVLELCCNPELYSDIHSRLKLKRDVGDLQWQKDLVNFLLN